MSVRSRGFRRFANCHAARLVLVLFFGLGMAGCERPKIGIAKDVEIPDVEVPGANLKTAEAAARDFFMHLQKRNTEKALAMVHPIDRDTAKKQIENPPVLPEELILNVRVKGSYAKIKCVTKGFEKIGLDLQYVDNRWYVILGRR